MGTVEDVKFINKRPIDSGGQETEIIANIIAELLVKTHNHQSYVIS